jgi:ATP-binding cassette subfamily B multidrug efflux pump
MPKHDYHDEEVLGKAYDARLMRRLLHYLLPYKAPVVAAVLLSIVVSLLELAQPYIVKVTIDEYILKAHYGGIARMSALLAATFLAYLCFEYARIYIISFVGQKAMYDIRMQIFQHLQRLSLSFFDRNPVGRLLTRMTSDVQVLNELFASGVVPIVGDVFLLAGIIILMLSENVILALLVVATTPLLWVATFVFRKHVRESYRLVRTRLARLNAYLNENLSGMKTVQAYNRQEKNFEDFSDINDSYRHANLKSVFYFALFFPTVELISTLAVALIIWYGGGAVIRNALTIGTLYLFLQYVERFFAPIRDLSDKYNIMQAAMASSERIFKLVDAPEDVKDPAIAKPLKPFHDAIVFDHVWFAYAGDDYVLRDVSFEVRKGEKIAIVGATGAGKTSIINLLCRFYDCQRGRILLDGINVKDLLQQDLRRLFGLVLQDVFLFFGDIASNIRLGNDAISMSEIEKIARYVNAHTFIERFPERYAQPVRERGATLSAGQKQLLAFARALAFNPQILILDEATANIDTETELLIQDAIARLLQTRTSIIIAHRLSTIQRADKIIVLHKGRIREVGSHFELLRNDGIYRKLYEIQYRDQFPQRQSGAVPFSSESEPAS